MRAAGLVSLAWIVIVGIAIAQSRSPFPGTLDEHPAIEYRTAPLGDVVTAMRTNAASGVTKLRFEGVQGYLPSILAALDVPIESQILVFSKTGIQNAFSSPETPRALYFNDRVIVGYIPGAPVIEMASHDPSQGVIFQTLAQSPHIPNQFARPDRCLSCHLSANSMEVPGILVRSMFTAPDGRSMPALGSFIINHRAPLEQRWGGWYVTGAHGAARHMGNAMITDAMNPSGAIGAQTLNRATLNDRVDASAYPTNTSDIAALMVFDHQGHAMNLLTRLGWESRVAAAEGRLDFSKGELREIVRETALYFSFADERALTAPVHGDGKFERVFTAAGRRDRRGRSLREFDLQTRLFKYRCSYMIYSPAFDALPPAARAAVYAELRGLITDKQTMEILDDTKPGWRE